MVIESLKAQIAALTEAQKEKGIPEKVVKTLKESASGLQKLLDKAREAAKEAKEEGDEDETGKEEGEEEEAGMAPAAGEGHVDPHKIKPGHKMTKTVTVKHDGPSDGEEGGDEPDPKDEKKDDDKDAEESRKVHIEMLLKEAGIPKEICSAEKLIGKTLKEAKEIIAEKKAEIDMVKKAVEGNLEFVPTGAGDGMHESTGGENLNSLFAGCAE